MKAVDQTDNGPSSIPVQRRISVAVLWIAIYLAIAAGLPYIFELMGAPDDDSAAAFAIGHAGLPIIIAAGLIFVHRINWPVWSVLAASFEEEPKRRWMLLVPIALLAQGIFLLFEVPWSQRSLTLILVIAVGTCLVGLGEELFFRGILRSAIDARYGETLTLLLTALIFGFAHSIGSMLHGLEIGFIALQVSVTAMDGLLLYAALKATGTLWIPIALHALADFGRYLTSGNPDPVMGHATPGSAVIWLQIVLGILAIPIIISAIRSDRRRRVPSTH